MKSTLCSRDPDKGGFSMVELLVTVITLALAVTIACIAIPPYLERIQAAKKQQEAMREIMKRDMGQGPGR